MRQRVDGGFKIVVIHTLSHPRATFATMDRQDDGPRQQTGAELHERQQRVRALHLPAAPAIVTVGLSTPENLGSVLRVADAAASSEVLIVDAPAPALAKMHRVARSTDRIIPWHFCSQEEVAARIQVPLIAIELTTSSTSLFETELPQACAFVLGGERHGVPQTMLARCERAVHIPMFGVNGSMNVTHALAIALFEWRRRFSSEVPLTTSK